MGGLFGWAARAAANAAERAVHRKLDDWGEQNRRSLRLGQLASQQAELARFIAAKQHEYDVAVANARQAGHALPVAVMLTSGWFDGKVAAVRYQMNGQRGRMDIFYGGAGSNPLSTPPYDYHGHVIVDGGSITCWFLPGPEHQRERVI